MADVKCSAVYGCSEAQCCAANSHDDEGDAALGKRYLHGTARRAARTMCGRCHSQVIGMPHSSRSYAISKS